MKNYAVIKNDKVENIIYADSKAIAEEITGLTCVEYSDANPAHVGHGYVNGTFEQPEIVLPEIVEG